MSTSESASPRFVFFRDGSIYSLITSNYLPEIPPPLADLDNPCRSLDSCQKPHWADPRYISLPFTPIYPEYTGPFSVLNIPKYVNFDQVPNGRGGMGWKTSRALGEAFDRLDMELHQIMVILSQKISLYGLDH